MQKNGTTIATINFSTNRWYPETRCVPFKYTYTDYPGIVIPPTGSNEVFADPNGVLSLQVYRFLNKPDGWWLDIGEEIHFLHNIKKCKFSQQLYDYWSNIIHPIKERKPILRYTQDYNSDICFFKQPLHLQKWEDLSERRKLFFLIEDVKVFSKKIGRVNAMMKMALELDYTLDQLLFFTFNFHDLLIS